MPEATPSLNSPTHLVVKGIASTNPVNYESPDGTIASLIVEERVPGKQLSLRYQALFQHRLVERVMGNVKTGTEVMVDGYIIGRHIPLKNNPYPHLPQILAMGLGYKERLHLHTGRSLPKSMLLIYNPLHG